MSDDKRCRCKRPAVAVPADGVDERGEFRLCHRCKGKVHVPEARQ